MTSDTELINISFIEKLYKHHIQHIIFNRKLMKKRILNDIDSFQPQFDDTESEITMLLIFHFKPKNIIEFSPCGGWSTSIILGALNINNNDGTLKSYDINDYCLRNVTPPSNTNWQFTKIDVSLKFDEFVSSNVDYLFIDSDHSKTFADNYINKLLIPLLTKCKKDRKQIIVSVHDVFHYSKLPSSFEGIQIINFLSENNIPYFTASCGPRPYATRTQISNPQNDDYLTENYKQIMKIKKELNIHEVIHKSWGRDKLINQSNSAIFFILK